MEMDQCTEADAIGWEFDGEDVDDLRDLDAGERREYLIKQRQVEMRTAYKRAKDAPTGSTITCPVCGKHYKKTTYHKVFDKTKCREKYWNFADEERWKATQLR